MGNKYDVVVLGAGILGLSTAVELVEQGVKAAIVARELPEDLDSAGFASPWAGANWSAYATNEAEQERERATFHHFDKLSRSHPGMIRRTPFVYVAGKDLYGQAWYKDLVYNYRRLDSSELPSGWKYGLGWDAFTLNAPLYLGYLAERLRSHGVPFIQSRLSALDEAYDLPAIGPVDLVINATGLGARSLLGVEDAKVYPAKGQTVLVRAPAVRANYGSRDYERLPKGEGLYIIPRPSPDGLVVLGGTYLVDDWSTQPDLKVAERILRNAYKLCPDLSGGKGWENIEVVKHNVGLRPCRKGGARIELERRKLTTGKTRLLPGQPGGKDNGRDVAVVHAYGIGPAGYQASHGIGKEAAALAMEYLRSPSRSASSAAQSAKAKL